jgi:para-nitrobenzyl esterase
MSEEKRYNAKEKPLIKTSDGLVEGFYEEGIYKFYGIPYAMPPIGELRWRAPRPMKPWQGVRKATSFGPMACQLTRLEQNINEKDKNLTESEDCLYLNIWTPSLMGGADLPVMVWIHGGGFLNGSGALSIYHGNELAKRGVVVVSFNYRLGPMGFMAYLESGEGDESILSGSFGIQDQIAVLEWIQKNIPFFGGNRDNVTIFGESAGAMSVDILSSSPRAKGLFHKGICQSGGLLTFPREIPTEKALSNTREFQQALGTSSIEEMRHIPAAKIIEAAKKAVAKDEMPRELRFGPILDNIVVVDQDKTLRERARIPLIIGNNKTEATWFMQLMPPVTMNNYREILNRNFGEIAEKMLAIFSVRSDEDARRAFIHVHTYNLFTIYVHDLAGRLSDLGGEVYVYRFDRIAPINQENGLLAGHMVEIDYMMGHVDAEGFTKTDEEVSDAMTCYWVQFSKTGKPGGEGLPEWPEYSSESKKYLIFDERITLNRYTDNEPFQAKSTRPMS